VLNQKRILVPISLGPEGLRLLEARPEFHVTRYDPAIKPAELHPLLADTAAIALSWTRFGAAEIAAAPHLEVAARIGVGFDSVDVPGPHRAPHSADGGRHRQLPARSPSTPSS